MYHNDQKDETTYLSALVRSRSDDADVKKKRVDGIMFMLRPETGRAAADQPSCGYTPTPVHKNNHESVDVMLTPRPNSIGSLLGESHVFKILLDQFKARVGIPKSH